MDLPYVPNERRIKELMLKHKWESESAIKFDYDNNWKEKSNLFMFQTRTVLALYTRFFSKYKTSECKGIVVECVEKVTESRTLNFTGIYVVQTEFCFDEFIKLSDYEKKKNILEIFKKGIDIVIKEKQFDKSVFDEPYRKVIEANYINEWYWKKALKNPTKEYSAIVFCEHRLDLFNISIVIRNKKNEEVKRVLLISEKPDELIYNIHLGQLKWVSDNTVSLINKFNTKQWSIKVE